MRRKKRWSCLICSIVANKIDCLWHPWRWWSRETSAEGHFKSHSTFPNDIELLPTTYQKKISRGVELRHLFLATSKKNHPVWNATRIIPDPSKSFESYLRRPTSYFLDDDEIPSRYYNMRHSRQTREEIGRLTRRQAQLSLTQGAAHPTTNWEKRTKNLQN